MVTCKIKRFKIVSVFCFCLISHLTTSEIKLKQICFVSVLFQFHFRCNHYFSRWYLLSRQGHWATRFLRWCRSLVMPIPRCRSWSRSVMVNIKFIKYRENKLIVKSYVWNVHHWHEHKHTSLLAICQLLHQSESAKSRAKHAVNWSFTYVYLTVTSCWRNKQNK